MFKYSNPYKYPGEELSMIIHEVERDDKERVYVFVVQKTPDALKRVVFIDLTEYKTFCSCMGYSIRKRCSHLNEVLKQLENDKRLDEKDKKLLDAEVNENWQ